MEQLKAENTMLATRHDKLVEHNMRLVMFLKEKETQIRKQELLMRKYRSRLVRWFEDMQYDPMEELECQDDGMQSDSEKKAEGPAKKA